MPATVPYRISDEPVPGYRLTDFLGRGGFGEVWKAMGPGGVLIAIKLIRLDDVAGRKELRALRLVKRLRHPNLVPIVAYWLKDEEGKILDDDAVAAIAGAPSAAETARWNLTPAGAPPRPIAAPAELIIAMGLGETNLHQRLKQCQAEGISGMPDEELFSHLLDAARGIDYLNRPMHDLGSGPSAIQHCDIKPQNLLVVGGAVQLCDFGLASMLGDVRSTSAAAGTIAYAAPECFRDGKPSNSTDQYSLAVTYYELKSGTLPYEEGSVAQISQAILRGQLNFSRVSQPEQEVLKRATALDPRKRYKTATDFVHALRNAVPDTTTVAFAPRRTAARRWAVVAGLAAALVVVALALWQQDVLNVNAIAGMFRGQPSTSPPDKLTLPSATIPADGIVLKPGQPVDPPAANSETKPDPAGPAVSSSAPASGQTTAPEPATSKPAPEWTNTLGMNMVLLPAGQFTMGTDESTDALDEALGPLPEGFDNSDEHPAHRVQISRPVYLGTNEVTVGQFRQFVDSNMYQTDAERDPRGGWGYDARTRTSTTGPKHSWRDTGFEQTDRSPVVNVSWNDARAFCEWLSTKEGKKYRLPTEAEWEAACRGGTTTRFSSGDTVADLRRVGNVLDQSALEVLPNAKEETPERDSWAFTAPVGSLTANPIGLFDVHGNVAEWCNDWHGDSYYASSPEASPSGSAEGKYRVIRGGSWIHPPVRCRSAYRGFDVPEFRSGYVGFRVACDAGDEGGQSDGKK